MDIHGRSPALYFEKSRCAATAFFYWRMPLNERAMTLVKVYGNLWPVGRKCLQAVQAVCGDAAELEGDLLRISFEGIWFPLEDLLDALAVWLRPDCQGKLDYLDLEAWRMTRYRFVQGKIQSSSRSLNDVLAYSGH